MNKHRRTCGKTQTQDFQSFHARVDCTFAFVIPRINRLSTSLYVEYHPAIGYSGDDHDKVTQVIASREPGTSRVFSSRDATKSLVNVCVCLYRAISTIADLTVLHYRIPK